MRKLSMLLLLAMLLATVGSLSNVATTISSQNIIATPLPTYTPFPTYTLLPPVPTFTPLPTYTPVPAYIVLPPSSTARTSGQNTDWVALVSAFLTFVTGIAAACAWPLIIIILAFSLKTPLLDLLRDVKRFRYGKFEAEFERGIRNLEQEAEEAELPSGERMEQDTAPGLASRLYRLAEINPRAAVIEAWLLVEEELRAAAMQLGLHTSPQASSIQILRALSKEQLISKSLLSITDELRHLRNIAVHEPEFVIEMNEVIDYIRLSLRVVEALSNVDIEAPEE
jgi:hypothetical protein